MVCVIWVCFRLWYWAFVVFRVSLLCVGLRWFGGFGFTLGGLVCWFPCICGFEFRIECLCVIVCFAGIGLAYGLWAVGLFSILGARAAWLGLVWFCLNFVVCLFVVIV